MKKNIVIAGYPKSGTTWATRLVAELVQCPIAGDWGFDTVKTSFETTLNPKSNFRVYKSHYEYQDLPKASKKEIYKIIYIIRDPRDIVISGVHFFNFTSTTQKAIQKLKIGRWISSEITPAKKRTLMIQAVLYGNEKLDPWLKTAWKLHTEGFQNTEALLITYEDLLAQPKKQCLRILTHLGLERSPKEITNAITKQAFDTVKQKAQQEKDPFLQKIVRQGGSSYWQSEFTPQEKQRFLSYLTHTPYEKIRE